MSSQIVLQLPSITLTRKTNILRDTKVSDTSDTFNKTITVLPVVVDFQRLLKSNNKVSGQVVEGIENLDLLHAAAHLYEVTLAELTEDIIYPTLCEKWSKTILMFRSEDEVFQSSAHHIENSLELPEIQKSKNEIVESQSMSQTVNLFSDIESGDEEEEDEEDNFLSDIPRFLASVQERSVRRNRFLQTNNLEGDDRKKKLPRELIGVEKRLIGCSTFERSYEKPGQRVTQVTLIAVRKKYRSFGVGHFMMKQIHDPTVTGGSDVVVVNADQNAIGFFEKEGFTDDVLLNSPYAHIGDVWFNSKRMCYLPSYVSSSSDSIHLCHLTTYEDDPTLLPDLDLKEMELELALWREKSLQAYQSQALLIRRMRQEVLTLRAKLAVREDQVKKLQCELEAVREVKLESSESILRSRIGKLREAMIELEEQVLSHNVDDYCESSSAQDNSSGFTDTPSHSLQPKKLNADPNQQKGYELKELQLLEVTRSFVTSMDSGEYNFSGTVYGVTKVVNIIPATPTQELILRHEARIRKCKQPELIANLYFCGTQDKITNDRMLEVLSMGFSEDDFSQSEHGRGLYFTRHARAASRFSPLNKVLVAKVCLGSTQTVTALDNERNTAPAGFESVLTRGRLATMDSTNHSKPPYSSWSVGFSEYIVFDVEQALPFALIEYESLYL